MSFICKSTANRAPNVGQMHHAGGKFAHGQISLIVRTNWGVEVTHEASTAMGMAFTSWRMSRGKVYELHLRIHNHEGLHILQLGPN